MMAANVIQDLDSQLASLNQLKPPGASKNKISSITQICVSNIQAESNVVQSLYRALKKAPATHKLGALYVIDSVVRQWIEKAKSSGQDLSVEGKGEPGTFAAAVKRVTELLPALFDDIIKGIPIEQKPKLENLLGIWDKGNTFPSRLLGDFKRRLNASPAVHNNGTVPSSKEQSGTVKFTAPVPSRPIHTPLGYPPAHLYNQGLIPGMTEQSLTNHAGIASNGNAQQPVSNEAPRSTAQVTSTAAAAAAPGSDVNSILAALASSVPKSLALTPASQTPVPNANPLSQFPPEMAAMFGQPNGPSPTFSVAPQPTALPMQALHAQVPGPQGHPYPQAPLYHAHVPQPTPSVPPPFAMAAPSQPPAPVDPLGPLRSIIPPHILTDQSKLIMLLNLLQEVQKQGVPMEQWGLIVQAFAQSDLGAQSQPPPQSQQQQQQQQQQQPQRQSPGHQDVYGRGRDRSRSPDGARAGGRGSPVYGSYDDMDSRRGNNREGRAGRERYRQRSPPMTASGNRGDSGHDGHDTAMNGMPMQPKYIAIDNSLPPNNIKVLSRTLFVGGANGSPQDIQQLFERFGRVQTCIANRDKRHAFVKMTTRSHAVAAKDGMEELQSRNDREVMSLARQTKWGVGFGPRECCDYQRGESIIPVNKLTEADMKWLLTAEYGGTGGKKVEGGMVLEEPDIEIGAGVSSKAMSKRIGPDHRAPRPQAREDPAPAVRPDARRGGMAGRGRGRDLDGAYAHNGGVGAAGGVATGGGYGNGMQGGAMPPSMEGFYPRPEPVAVATPPAVPTFGFSLPPGGQTNYR